MPRDRALLDWLRIERRGGASLHRQISEQLEAAIRDGRLAPGTPLPSSRLLAADLLVSRGTVTAVYDRLIGDGLLQVRERSAIFVGDARRIERPLASAAVAKGRSRRGKTVRDPPDESPPRLYTAFQPGVPAFDIFPARRWGRLLSARCHQMSVDLAGEGMHIGGYPALRSALAQHLRTARGVSCVAEQIIIAGSARAALAAVCRLLTKPGERCLVEDPGYMIARRIVTACGLEPVPIPVDADGMVVAPPVPRARLAYVTPTHQLPLGVRLADHRCQILIEWARQEEAWIVEDDYDSEFRYAGQPVVALQHSDPNGRVIYIGTFSKTLFPGLRIAFLVVPERLAKATEQTVYLNGQAPTLHVQAALADFIAQGHYATHIRKARSVYRRRQGALVDALNHHLEGIVTIARPPGGMNLVVPLPPDIPAREVQARAAEQEIHARAISYYTEGKNAPNALHLGFAAVVDRLIEPAAARLAGVVRSFRSGSMKSLQTGTGSR